MMNHIYTVPIIPQNLNKQETIIQIAEVLNHLTNVTHDIIDRINVRIEANNRKISDIKKRIDNVNMKITKLTGAKKATQVFSSSKYPAVDVNKPYISIFDNVEPIELVRHKVKYKKLPSNDDSTKLQIYHVKVKNDHRKPVVGLGEIPCDIECVNDLLLYNSGKNLYKNFVMADALQVQQLIKEQEVNDNIGIGVAPLSIRERSTLTRSTTHNYFYTPNLGEVPTLDVPLDLPDLPGVADDLRYETDLDPAIAPSVITTPNIPDLPLIDDSLKDKEPINENIELPPPPPMLQQQQQQQSEIPETTTTVVVTTKLETENQKPSITEPEIIIENHTQPPVKVELPPVDARASLMEAIRKAGGSKNANLKSTDAVKNEQKSKINTGGGDLMADLHAKLSMRRKGISGAKKTDNILDATLEKISSMVPPTVRTETNDNNTEDEDWDD